MKNNDIEKYITELSPELQEKARQCKNKDELNKLLADNDVELSEDALAAVAGGLLFWGSYDENLHQGDQVNEICPGCGQNLYYWDWLDECGNRYYCNNSDCDVCLEKILFYNCCGHMRRYRG